MDELKTQLFIKDYPKKYQDWIQNFLDDIKKLSSDNKKFLEEIEELAKHNFHYEILRTVAHLLPLPTEKK